MPTPAATATQSGHAPAKTEGQSAPAPADTEATDGTEENRPSFEEELQQQHWNNIINQNASTIAHNVVKLV